MLTYATIQATQVADSSEGILSVRALLVSDCIENFPRLKGLLQLSSQAVTYVQTVEELDRTYQDFYDFVLVDVGPEHIVYALRAIRASALLQDAPLWVRAERLGQAFEFASALGKHRSVRELGAERLTQQCAPPSIFTKYRALPGLDTELAKLVSSGRQEKAMYGLHSFSREQVIL